jgi:hypothetical protein
VVLVLDQRPARLDGRLDDGRQGDARPFDLHLAARDARDVEQIIDQPHHVRDLPSHDPERLRRRAAAGGASQYIHTGADRRERVSELVRQRGQKLVLASVRAPQLLCLPGELGLRLLQGLVHALALGHVEHHAGHALRPPRGVIRRPTPHHHPVQLAVGPDDAVLDVIVGGVAHALLDRQGDPAPVLGVNASRELAVRKRLVQRTAEAGLADIRAVELVSLEVQVPGTQPAGGEGEAELLVLGAELRRLLLAQEQRVANLILMTPIAQRRRYHADQSPRAHRPLHDDQAAQHGREGPPFPAPALARQHQNRNGGPRGLLSKRL